MVDLLLLYKHYTETSDPDIALAASHGIDGFALNVGVDDWQSARVADAYQAANGTDFKLFISLDMSCVIDVLHFALT